MKARTSAPAPSWWASRAQLGWCDDHHAWAASASPFLLGTLASVLLLAWPTAHAWPQTAGDPAAGKAIAEIWCSACHVVSPTQQGGSSSGAPPFTAIAKMKSATPMGLRVFLQTPHGRMSDLHLTREEIANLSAYILSLKQKS
jgi:mono/diheme cytochrome c family protein